MISRRTRDFNKLFHSLPQTIQKLSIQTYKLWSSNPNHPGLHFKQIGSTEIWSIRIGAKYRAFALIKEDNIARWFWIGSHEHYNQLLKQLRNIAKGKISYN
ncbi:MAG: hypothetical protein ABSG15_07820 [FCB group bacterium]|jgi:hypothetical protein